MTKPLLLFPFAWFTLWHGWLLPLPSWAPPEHPVIAAEERLYRNADPEGYLRFIEATRAYGIRILKPDRTSEWFQALPDFIQGASMFVWDSPTIWVQTSYTDQATTLSVIEHELAHVLSRWYPGELLAREGIAGPPVDINDWRTWAEQEVYAANIQLRVARRLGSEAGVRFALRVAEANLESMDEGRRERFLAEYGWWLAPEITEGQVM